jgi:hypothetical protein
LLYGRGALTSLLKRHPVASTVAIGLIPNLLLTVLNIAYNWQEIVRRLSPNEQHTFSNQIMTVNSVAYGVGLGYVVLTRGRMFAALMRLARGEKLAEPPSLEMKRRCLSFGAAVAMITAALWAVSGFIFPAWMQFGAGEASRLEPMHYAHFIVSNLLCGMIAATQSYYVVTFLALRYCYPWLLSARAPDANEAADLAALLRRSVFFLAWTVSVPFLALGALVLINFDRPVMGALGLLGLFSCGFAYALDLTIRADVSALAAAINPSGDALGSSDSFDSLVTGSRR